MPLLLDLARRAAPYLIAVAVVAAVLFGAYHHGVSVTEDKYERRAAEQEAANIKALNELNDKAIAAERQHAIDLAAIDQRHQGDLKNEIDSRDRIITDLRSGAMQLRKRFTCAPAVERVPAVAARAGIGDAGQAGGLQREDAEFLVREASRADEVVLQLRACQGVVRDDRVKLAPTNMPGGGG